MCHEIINWSPFNVSGNGKETEPPQAVDPPLNPHIVPTASGFTMPLITDLPVELQANILHNVYLFSRKEPDYMSVIFQDADGVERPARTAIQIKPEDMEWEASSESRETLFPYNAASVCRLWCSILQRSAEYWSRILFDVAYDPTPLLDSFSWSKSWPISVYVFNSCLQSGVASSTHELSQESRRIAKITGRLFPHIHRCTSITFDAVCASSLPLPEIVFSREVPYLETFRLDCAIDDLQHDRPGSILEEAYTVLVDVNIKNYFPALRTISLTGDAFMGLNPNWISTLHCGETVSLSISHLALEKHDDGPGTTGRAFNKLLKHIQRIRSLRDLRFKNFTLPEFNEGREMTGSTYFLQTLESIHFDTMCEGFLQLFNEKVFFAGASTTTFSNCTIPATNGVFGWGTEGSLVLENIPYPRWAADDDSSLYNILKVWGGDSVVFSSCGGFNDTFLNSLCELFRHSDLSRITIEDCTGFTVDGMKRFLEEYERGYSGMKTLRGMTLLRILGDCPRLSEADLSWVQALSSFQIMEWAVVDGNNKIITTNPHSMYTTPNASNASTCGEQ